MCEFAYDLVSFRPTFGEDFAQYWQMAFRPNWAHSMGPQRSPLTRVVVVVVVVDVVVDIDAQAACDSGDVR